MEENKRINEKSNSNKDFSNNKFITCINALSECIKEYYKVSININQNKIILIKTLEEILNFSRKNDKLLKEIKIIFNQLNKNFNSEKNNLNSFFNDSKIILKEMKEYHNSTKNKVIGQRYNTINTSNPNSHLKNTIFKKLNQDSKKNYKIENNQNSLNFHEINLNKSNRQIKLLNFLFKSPKD